MSDSTVIREFLVSLGFKTDERSLKNFTAGVENATKQVGKMVVAIEGAALAVGAAVASFAANMEQLHFSSQRTGASVQGIRALEYAAQSLGASAGEAMGAVEGLARFMRDTPGGGVWIKSMFGVDTEDAAGNAKDNAEVLLDIGKKLAKMPWWEAQARAEPLGISEKMLMAMRNGDIDKFMAEYRNMTKNVDFEKMEKDAQRFMQAMRRLGIQLEALGYKVADALSQKLGGNLNDLSAWFDKNGQQIANRVAEITLLFMELAEIAGPAIMWVVDKLIALDKETDGMSTKIIAATALFNLLGGAAVVAGIWNLVKAMTALGSATAAAGAGGLLARLLPLALRMGGAAALLFHSGGLNEGEDEWAEEQRKKRSGNGGGRINTEWAMKVLQGFGWTREQAAGMLGNIKNESSFDPAAQNGSHYGLAQWDAKRQADFEKWSGKSMRGSSGYEQLAFMNYEMTKGAEGKAGALLRAATNAEQASNIVYREYERAGDNDVTGPRRARDAVNISNTTQITVNGAGNPAEVGRYVADEQVRVHERISRNNLLGAQ